MALQQEVAAFVAAQQAFNAREAKAVDDILAEVKALNDKITALQNSTGEVTPEDQALLDQATAQSQAIVDKLEALDAAQTTPPPAPPAA